MIDVPARNAPVCAGWAIAFGMGAAFAGVSWVAMGLGGVASVFLGGAVFAGAGLILGLPRGDLPGPGAAVMPSDDPVPDTATAAPAPAAAPPAGLATAPAPAAVAPAPSRPAGLATARDGRPDDLKIIRGIGPKLEELCHRLGYYHFDQIAGWNAAEVAWVDDNLEGFRGRVTRDRWVPQAKAILSLGRDAFLKRLDAGETF